MLMNQSSISSPRLDPQRYMVSAVEGGSSMLGHLSFALSQVLFLSLSLPPCLSEKVAQSSEIMRV